ncbi:hypothetical protein GCM10017714_32420 [Curtobacterium pusillum]|uniref:Uncharacterized protein n=1 Tax=Curtobacterium pusillum TaxID=69373 RepID=A0ABX2MA57_9MICO|nr:hypothetical protein [Curtobacterium pusillum]NUU14731.1 hypothetical protein [Curtobacterium pusillum]GLK31724.1 hypothetical protein GCM10017610_20090 [Curtobacterium pusillum]
MNRVAAWYAVTVVTIVIVLFCALYQVGSCADAARGDGESVCTSGPAVGVPALWSIVVVGASVVAVAIWQIIRNTRRTHR